MKVLQWFGEMGDRNLSVLAQEQKNKSDKLSFSDLIKKQKQLLKICRLLATSSFLLMFFSSCTSTVDIDSAPQNVDTNTSQVPSGNASIYSVMYRVWARDECTARLDGTVINELYKEGKFNGFVCVSQIFNQIGQEDTIGINFYAEDLEHCQQIVSSYWTETPSSRYSWYPILTSLEQNQLQAGNNTCTVEYPTSR